MGRIKLSDVLSKEMTMLDIEPYRDKVGLFRNMAKCFEKNGIVSNSEAFYQALQKREEEGPTYMGNFIAMPHGMCDEVIKAGVGFCRFRQPMRYESNGEAGDVKYVFMLAIAGDNGRNEYLEILATLARMMMHEEIHEIISEAGSYEEIIERIGKIDFE